MRICEEGGEEGKIRVEREREGEEGREGGEEERGEEERRGRRRGKGRGGKEGIRTRLKVFSAAEIFFLQ